jgi:hypothetical protein
MDEYVSREAVFQVVHGIARGIANRDTEALKAKNMKAFYMVKGAKEILDSVDTDLCYIPATSVQPVKSERWEYSKKEYGECAWYFCAFCDEPAEQLYNDEPLLSEFCPNCGARMEGDIR